MSAANTQATQEPQAPTFPPIGLRLLLQHEGNGQFSAHTVKEDSHVLTLDEYKEVLEFGGYTVTKHDLVLDGINTRDIAISGLKDLAALFRSILALHDEPEQVKRLAIIGQDLADQHAELCESVAKPISEAFGEVCHEKQPD